MLEYFSTVIRAFGSFVAMLFELPFIGAISYGHMILGLYVSAVVLLYLVGRVK
ncbi:MAG: hypothetical protein NC305_04010 [Lachnospiraceae bacterium]|nr:hypothetical protein [Muribaculaceae bacterium]MCM1409696.1 hypothetical protein [Lachnospiraceae bacterium]